MENNHNKKYMEIEKKVDLLLNEKKNKDLKYLKPETEIVVDIKRNKKNTDDQKSLKLEISKDLEYNKNYKKNKKIITIKNDEKKEKLANKLNKKYIMFHLFGLILISIGCYFIINPTILNLKISMTLLLLGLFMVFLIFKKRTYTKIKNIQMTEKPQILIKDRLLKSEQKIVLSMIIWVLLIFVMTINTSLEIYIILISLGIVIIKELSDEFTTSAFKFRMNFFFLIGIILFMITISQKILTILNV